MLRGSTTLLQRSVRTFVPVIEALVKAPTGLWTLDVESYDKESIADLRSFASTLARSLHEGASPILVTKVLLGTMGCVPAFDSLFKEGFGASTFGPKALGRLGSFYKEHAETIETHRERTLDFHAGQPTERRYTQAKVIDMIFFVEGERLARRGKR